MTFVLALICLALAALAGWLLGRALLRAKAQGHAHSIVTQDEGPFGFRATVTVNAIALLVFGAAAAALLYRAIVPLTVPQRAQSYYPRRALARDAEGAVVLRCTVTESYGMKDCTVRSETPPGLGFGAAALQISGFTVLSEKDRDRNPPGREINLPIRFKLPKDR